MKLHWVALMWILAGCLALCAGAQNSTPRPYHSDKPMAEPEMFGEDVISTRDYESGLTLAPDGQSAYFVKSTSDLSFRAIVVSRFAGGKWSMPEVASFSGQYVDTDPCFSPDGTKLYFSSRRPLSGAAPKADADIWVAEKTATGWSEPRRLDAAVNSESQETAPSVTADGTLYFSSNRPGGKGAADIYRARLVNGKYAEPENLGEAINTASPESQAFVAPDERVLIFASAGQPDGLGSFDLYASARRRADGVWSKAAHLGGKVNSSAVEASPSISPDGRYFFWTSTRGYGFTAQQEKRLSYRELSDKLGRPRNSLGDIYQIDLSELPIKQ